MLAPKLLSSVVDEVLSLSACSPHTISIVREVFHAYYANNTLLTSDDYPLIITALYNMDDDKNYSVITLSFADEYVFFLMKTENVMPKDAMREIVARIKQESNFTNTELGEAITGIHAIKSMLQIIMKSSIRTSRKAEKGNTPKPPPALPPIAELKRFYECERKAQYFSQEEAALNLSGNNEIYSCTHCGNLHQGQHPTGMTVPIHIMEGRYKTTWRRYHGI